MMLTMEIFEMRYIIPCRTLKLGAYDNISTCNGEPRSAPLQMVVSSIVYIDDSKQKLLRVHFDSPLRHYKFTKNRDPCLCRL
jgi:hypothetical protein